MDEKCTVSCQEGPTNTPQVNQSGFVGSLYENLNPRPLEGPDNDKAIRNGGDAPFFYIGGAVTYIASAGLK